MPTMRSYAVCASSLCALISIASSTMLAPSTYPAPCARYGAVVMASPTPPPALRPVRELRKRQDDSTWVCGYYPGGVYACPDEANYCKASIFEDRSAYVYCSATSEDFQNVLTQGVGNWPTDSDCPASTFCCYAGQSEPYVIQDLFISDGYTVTGWECSVGTGFQIYTPGTQILDPPSFSESLARLASSTSSSSSSSAAAGGGGSSSSSSSPQISSSSSTAPGSPNSSKAAGPGSGSASDTGSNSGSSSGLSSGTKTAIGAGVGAGVGVLLIAVALFIFYRRRQKQKEREGTVAEVSTAQDPVAGSGGHSAYSSSPETSYKPHMSYASQQSPYSIQRPYSPEVYQETHYKYEDAAAQSSPLMEQQGVREDPGERTELSAQVAPGWDQPYELQGTADTGR